MVWGGIVVEVGWEDGVLVLVSVVVVDEDFVVDVVVGEN